MFDITIWLVVEKPTLLRNWGTPGTGDTSFWTCCYTFLCKLQYRTLNAEFGNMLLTSTRYLMLFVVKQSVSVLFFGVFGSWMVSNFRSGDIQLTGAGQGKESRGVPVSPLLGTKWQLQPSSFLENQRIGGSTTKRSYTTTDSFRTHGMFATARCTEVRLVRSKIGPLFRKGRLIHQPRWWLAYWAVWFTGIINQSWHFLTH